MSRDQPATFTEWWQNLPIPWLVGGPNGQLEATALGTVMDQQIATLRAAAKVSFPDYAPTDALPHIGGDRLLIKGPAESNASFIARLKDAWGQWARAGTPVGLLEQLWYTGFPNAIITTQNGLAYTFSSAPTAGVDPTALLVITNLGTNPCISGTPPWWTFDLKDYFCSRFAVLFYGVPPPSFTAYATATFTGAEDGIGTPWPTVTWNNAFQDTTYKIIASAPIITDGSGPVAIYTDAARKTMTGVQVSASASFVGSVHLVAYQAGAQSPFADPHPTDLSRLRTVISRWRPGETTCVGIYACVQGKFIGWPVRNAGNGAAIGPSTIVTLSS